MAAPRIFSLSRTFLSTTTTTTTTLSRTFFSSSISSATIKSPSSTFSLLHRLRPLSSIAVRSTLAPAAVNPRLRAFSTRQSQNNALADNNANYTNRPPKETILLDGCDFEHWLVVTEPPPDNATRDEIIDSYIKTLAQIVGSEEEARMKIYSVSTKHYYAFGALVSEELSFKLKELPHVRWVLPDSYLDVKNKDYGGEPFINGEAVPYDPKYHEEWVRNNAKAQDRNRRNDRPRNADRSRNFERRQQPRSNPGPGGPGGNMGGPGGNMGGPGGNMGGPPPNHPGGAPPNRPPNNAGYGPPPNNAGYGPPPNNAGYGPPPNNAGYGPPPNNAGYGPPPNNAGYGPPPNNAGYGPPPNNPNRMPSPNYGGQGNPGYRPQQNPNMSNQNYPQQNMGGQQGAYQPQDVPGRDVSNY